MRGIGSPRKTRPCTTIRRTTMNNLLFLALALMAGLLLGAIFFAGALVSRQHIAADEHRARWILFYRAWRLASAGRLFARIYHRANHRDAADPHANRTFKLPSEGGRPCALVLTS